MLQLLGIQYPHFRDEDTESSSYQMENRGSKYILSVMLKNIYLHRSLGFYREFLANKIDTKAYSYAKHLARRDRLSRMALGHTCYCSPMVTQSLLGVVVPLAYTQRGFTSSTEVKANPQCTILLGCLSQVLALRQ